MSKNQLYANIYKMSDTQFRNLPSVIVGLCEKAISSVYNAKEYHIKGDFNNYISNLDIVNQVIQVLLQTVAIDSQNETFNKMQKLYSKLELYVAGLLIQQIEIEKLDILLETFIIIRNTWHNIEKEYVKVKSDGDDNPNLDLL